MVMIVIKELGSLNSKLLEAHKLFMNMQRDETQQICSKLSPKPISWTIFSLIIQFQSQIATSVCPLNHFAYIWVTVGFLFFFVELYLRWENLQWNRATTAITAHHELNYSERCQMPYVDRTWLLHEDWEFLVEININTINKSIKLMITHFISLSVQFAQTIDKLPMMKLGGDTSEMSNKLLKRHFV